METIETHKERTTPVDFFLNLMMIAMLYFGVFSLLYLLFSVIDYALPDPQAAGFVSSDIRWDVASLIIVTPIYLLIARYLNREYERIPERRQVAVRKWLVYLTLFIAGLSMVIDSVYLIYTFLGGEITMRFALKVLAVLVVAAGIFSYYLYDVRRGKGLVPFAAGTIIVVLGSVIAGFAVMGSPATQRALRIDSERVSDLQNIQNQISYYYQQKGGNLPATLSDLNNALQGYAVPKDPATGKPYDYQVLGPLKFQLCATFDRGTPDTAHRGAYTGSAGYYPPSYPGIKGSEDYFQHAAGRACFERAIDPDFFRPQGKNIAPTAPSLAPPPPRTR